MKVHRYVRSRGSIAFAMLLGAVLCSAQAYAQQPVVTATADPEIAVTTPPVTRFINFAATPGSYVLIARVDATGNLDVLYPAVPSVDLARVKSAALVQVPTIASTPKTFHSSAVFAFVSSTPYDFSKVASGNGWNSLHLSSYAGITDELIARAFGSDVAGPNARVIMSRATPGGRMAINRTSGGTIGSLASFKSNPCPSVWIPVYGASAPVTCIAKTLALPGSGTPASQGKPMTSTK